MNFYDEGHEGFHMMDWHLETWLSLILVVGIILVIAIVLILIFIYFNRNISLKNQTFQAKTGIQGNGIPRIHTKVHEKDVSEVTYFCHNCGEKLDGHLLKYCSHCGVKL